MTILEKIISHKQQEIRGLEEKVKNYNPKKSTRNFLEAIKKINKNSSVETTNLGGSQQNASPNLIAEIKKASPSKGDIFPDAPVSEVAKIYENSGVAAISVLTDEKFFSGNVEDLQSVSEAVNIPVLRKDFFLSKAQILEARQFGADAILLMTSVLKTSEKLRVLREYAESFGMHALIETHDEKEIQVAIESGAKIIGVNARDFKDLTINTENFQTLLPMIPDHIVKIAESGLLTREDVKKVVPIADAMLVGSSIMGEGISGIQKKIYELRGR